MPKKDKKDKPVKTEPIDTAEIEPIIKETTKFNNYQYLCDSFKKQQYNFI